MEDESTDLGMLGKIGRLLSELTSEDQNAVSLKHSELRIASAALLVHAAFIDGSASIEEQTTIRRLLQEKYELSDSEASELMAEAETREKQAVDLYSFTKSLTAALDQEGRKEIVEMLWRVVLADNIIDDYEDHLVRQVSELIGVSNRDRILIRKSVEASIKSG